MKKVEIYEPAGCASGVCDPMIEADLIRIERMVKDLRERGVSVSRYNVIDDMPAFMDSFVVKLPRKALTVCQLRLWRAKLRCWENNATVPATNL